MDKCPTVDGSDLDSGSLIKYLWWGGCQYVCLVPTLCLTSPPLSHFTQSQANIDIGVLEQNHHRLDFIPRAYPGKNPFSIRKIYKDTL